MKIECYFNDTPHGYVWRGFPDYMCMAFVPERFGNGKAFTYRLPIIWKRKLKLFLVEGARLQAIHFYLQSSFIKRGVDLIWSGDPIWNLHRRHFITRQNVLQCYSLPIRYRWREWLISKFQNGWGDIKKRKRKTCDYITFFISS